MGLFMVLGFSTASGNGFRGGMVFCCWVLNILDGFCSPR